MAHANTSSMEFFESAKWRAQHRNHEWLATQGAWPTNQDEYALAHFIILAFFVVITALLDNGVNMVKRSLEPEERHLRRSEFRRELGLIVWMRLQGELMVVGSLVVWIWLAHESGLLEGVAHMSVTWQREHPSVDENPVTDPLADPGRLAQWMEWQLSCHPRTPRDATTLLHVLQDVLVALFLAKVLYFLFLLLALRTQTEWLATYERLESGGAPRNPAEHFSWRQIDAMREQLLQVLNSEPTLRAKIERSADLKASVDRGSLYVSGSAPSLPFSALPCPSAALLCPSLPFSALLCPSAALLSFLWSSLLLLCPSRVTRGILPG